MDAKLRGSRADLEDEKDTDLMSTKSAHDELKEWADSMPVCNKVWTPTDLIRHAIAEHEAVRIKLALWVEEFGDFTQALADKAYLHSRIPELEHKVYEQSKALDNVTEQLRRLQSLTAISVKPTTKTENKS